MNEKIEVPTMKVPPLKKICMTIGQLPASYVESMSYYEMLVWFVQYLRDDIIPVVNANGEATEELQELYVELQEYVNNYFDNLDVQEEINNKLDKMAQDGSLTNLIENYMNPYIEEQNNIIGTFISNTTNDLGNFKASINNEIQSQNNKIASIVSGSPIPVSTTDEMIDTTKLYLLTSDTYVYYYNGTQWVQGWVYQASILDDNEVHINNLDEYIDEEIGIVNVNETLTAGTFINYQNTATSNANFGRTEPFQLLKGQTIIYKCKNTTQVSAICLTDVNESYYKSVVRGTGNTSSAASVYKYTATEDCYIIVSAYLIDGQPDPFYISIPANKIKNYVKPLEFEVLEKNHIDYLLKAVDEDINTNSAITFDYEIDATWSGKEIYCNVMLDQATFEDNNVYVGGYDNSNTLISSYNIGNVSKQKYFIYRIPDDAVKLKLGVRNYGNNLIHLQYATLSLNKTIANPLYGKSMIAFGDSITHGANNNATGGRKSYATIIAERNGMNFTNYAQSGGTIVETPNKFYIGGSVDTAISEKTYKQADYIIVSGGLNDTADSYNNPIGTFEINDFSGLYDESTILGELETMFYKLKNHFIGSNQMAKIVYVITYPVPSHINWYELRSKIKQLCNKWAIYPIDIGEKTGLIANSNLSQIQAQFLTDGIHPNNNCYELIATAVENEMKSL